MAATIAAASVARASPMPWAVAARRPGTAHPMAAAPAAPTMVWPPDSNNPMITITIGTRTTP
jgi:hypothetical protein